VHATAGKGNSRNSAYCIVHRTPPQNRKARSLAHPNSITDPYMLWCWIDIRDRECSTAAVDLDRTTHGSCVALHSPLSGVAIPGPCPCCQRHVFPCWLSSASSGLGLAGWRCVLTIAEYTLGWTPLGSSRVAQVWRRSCQRISRIPARLSKSLKRLFTMFWVIRGCPLRMRIPRRDLARLR
jgi:hypothetical protein